MKIANNLTAEILSRGFDSRDQFIGLNKKEISNYSITRAIQASLTGDWEKAGLERAASEAVAVKLGRSTTGSILVPAEARWHYRAFDAGTPGNAGSLVNNEVRGSEMGDALRANLVFGKMGVSIINSPLGNITIPRKTATTATGVVTEMATLTPGQPTTDHVVMTAHRAAGQVIYTKQAVLTACLDMEKMLEADMVASLAAQMEYLGLNGTGGIPQPTGLLNTAGLGSVVGGTNGAQIAWPHLVDLEAACATVNAEPNGKSGYVVNPQSRRWMKKTQRGTNLPFIWGGSSPDFPLSDYMAGATNNVPSNLNKGTSAGVCSAMIFGADWSEFLLALFGAVDVVVDPVTKADKGDVGITVTQFFDVGVRQPAGFAVMLDALTV